VPTIRTVPRGAATPCYVSAQAYQRRASLRSSEVSLPLVYEFRSQYNNRNIDFLDKFIQHVFWQRMRPVLITQVVHEFVDVHTCFILCKTRWFYLKWKHADSWGSSTNFPLKIRVRWRCGSKSSRMTIKWDNYLLCLLFINLETQLLVISHFL
jgi:hypothetical protein